MLSWAMTKWTKDHHQNQHGFLPGKGLWSAWLEILTNVRHRRTIVEYDLTKCFNSIPLAKQPITGLEREFYQSDEEYKAQTLLNVLRSQRWDLSTEYNKNQWLRSSRNVNKTKITLECALRDLDIPEWVIKRIIRLNQTIPKMDSKQQKKDPNDPELWHTMGNRWDRGSFIADTGGELNLHNDYYGLSQGSPVSPILCNIFLNKWDGEKMHKLKYADDGRHLQR